MKKQTRKKILLYLFLIIGVFGGIYHLSNQIKSEDIVQFVDEAGIWAPAFFITIFLFTHVIAPISGTPVFFAGYVLFKNKVQIYTYLATLLSATINFWIARKWGRSLVSKLPGKKTMEKIDRFTKNYGCKSLILLRMFPGYFTDFISYSYGLTNMQFPPYIVITALAPIPWLLLWQFYIFRRVKDIGDLTVWFIAMLIPLFIIPGLFLKYKHKQGCKD